LRLHPEDVDARRGLELARKQLYGDLDKK